MFKFKMLRRLSCISSMLLCGRQVEHLGRLLRCSDRTAVYSCAPLSPAGSAAVTGLLQAGLLQAWVTLELGGAAQRAGCPQVSTILPGSSSLYIEYVFTVVLLYTIHITAPAPADRGPRQLVRSGKPRGEG